MCERVKKIILKCVNLKLSAFSENMLRIFLPIIIITLFYILSFLCERGEDAGSYTYFAASEMLDKMYLSLFLLFTGVFAHEYNIRHRKDK